MLILELILISFIGCVIGYTGYYFCRALDSWMDYGSIFYQLRLRKFLSVCYKHGYTDLIEAAGMVGDVKGQDQSDFAEHIDYMNSLFWTLADRVHSFKLWVCVDCMSVRYVVYVSFSVCVLICLYLSSPFYLLTLPLINLMAIVTIYRINAGL